MTDDAAAAGGAAVPDGGASGGQPADPPAADEGERDLATALAAFASARAELARIEAGEAARQAARKGGLAGGALAAAGFAWGLVLAGGLGWAAAKGWPWHWIAIGTGLVHLLVALVLGICLALPAPPLFALTRRELEKDKQWLENLKTKLKSRG